MDIDRLIQIDTQVKSLVREASSIGGLHYLMLTTYPEDDYWSWYVKHGDSTGSTASLAGAAQYARRKTTDAETEAERNRKRQSDDIEALKELGWI